MKDDRPVLALYYHPRLRSPSSTDLYKYMRDHSKVFRTILITDTAEGMSLEREMKHRNDGKPPDIVMDGFGAFTGSLVSKDYILKNDVKVVRTVGDVEVHSGTFFNGAGHHKHNTEMFTDALFFPVSPDTPSVDRLRYYTEDLLTQKDSDIICIPFGVDVDKFKPAKEKTMDVTACYVSDAGNSFQSNRHSMNDVLSKWSEYVTQAQKFYIEMKDNPEREKQKGWDQVNRMFGDGNHDKMYIHIGPTFYDYPDLVNRTNIALADTSKRQYMTNKYLEFGAAECCIVGEIPTGYDKLLNKDTMVEVDMANIPFDLPRTLDRLLFTEDGRKESRDKGRKLRNLIKKDYSLERTCEKIEKRFKEML